MTKTASSGVIKQPGWQRLRRPLTWLAWAVATLLVLAAISWQALPYLVRKIAIAQTQEKIGRKLDIGALAFNPFRLALTASDITLYEADGKTPFFGAKSLLVNASSMSLLRLAPVVDEIKLTTPQLHVVRIDAQGIGHYNFSDILERIAALPKSEGESRFSLANVQLQDGDLRFEDKVTGKTITIASLQLGLPFISNLPGNIDSFVQPQLSAVINGTPLHLKGRSKPFAASQESAFAIDIDKLDLVSYLPFVPVELPVALRSATLSTRLDLGFVRKDDKPKVALSGDVTLDDISVQDKSQAPLLKLKQLKVQLQQFDVLAASGEISEVTLDHPQVWAAMNARGDINWLRALAGNNAGTSAKAKSTSPAPAAAPANTAAAQAQTPAVIVLQQLNVHQGEINWRDEANAVPAQTVQLSQIEISAAQLSTASDAKPAQLKLSMLENGHGKLGFDGDIAPLKPAASGKLTLAGVDLAGYRNYLHSAPVDDVAGKLSGNATLQFRDGHLKIDDSTVELANLQLTPKDAKAAAPISVQSISLRAQNVTDTLDQAMRLNLQARFDKTGKFDVSGQVAPHLKNVDLELDARDLPIAPFQGYFANVLNVTISSGLLSAKGKLAVTPPLGQQKFALDYKGSAALNNLRMQDKVTATDFLRWRTLDVSGIQARIGGRPQVSLEKVALNNFYARAILSDKGRLNLQDILVADAGAQGSITDDTKKDAKGNTGDSRKTTSTAPVTAPVAPANAPIVRVGKVVIDGGNINYTDNFVKPNYTANMTGLSGSIGEISSEKPQPAPINISGKIDNDAPLQISGALNPLFKPMYLDLKASANGVQLPRLTPYSAKYAGYPITKGKLSMDVQYKIENDKLVAQNDLRIEQLSFGERVDSPSATNLPVMLAVSLLKDREGNINLNLPISGSLSDPQFSVGGIIVRVFVNLIVKAVTSPFALIGSMFRSDENIGELRYIEFAPGSAEVDDTVRKKLDALGYVLHERPGIKLDITGRVDPQVDDQGLRQEALERQIRALKRADLIAKEGQPSGPIRLSDAERAKYLERVYKDSKFDKPRNAIGLTKSIPAADMEKLIIEHTQVTQDDLRNLAQRRADQVRNYLQEQSIIEPARIFLIAPKLDGTGIDAKEPKARVDLTIQ